MELAFIAGMPIMVSFTVSMPDAGYQMPVEDPVFSGDT